MTFYPTLFLKNLSMRTELGCWISDQAENLFYFSKKGTGISFTRLLLKTYKLTIIMLCKQFDFDKENLIYFPLSNIPPIH